MNKATKFVCTLACAASAGAFADFNINLDLSGKPMRDLSKSTSKAIVGYISALHEYGDDYWFVTNKYETAAAMKKAGCYNTATWSSDMWFNRRNDPNPKKRSNPKAQFDFWKQNGFKVLIGLSGIGPQQAADEVIRRVKAKSQASQSNISLAILRVGSRRRRAAQEK